MMDVDSARRQTGWRAGLAVGAVLAIASSACTGHPDVVHLPAAPSPYNPATTHCDGGTASVAYEQFAQAFNADEIALATAQFAGQHPGFTWWDPSDPSGGTQDRTQLADHFRRMRGLGVRLPATATFVGSDDTEQGGFTFNHGQVRFSGKGSLDCTTGKLSYLVIAEWTKEIAGHAPVDTA
jgi:hypothetical protein